MVYKLNNLINEFKRYILESKSYGIDYFSDKISDLIYLSGLFFALSIAKGNIGIVDIIKLLTWFILYNASLNAVSDAEFEIRSDFFKNLSYSRTSIWSIYLNRFIVYGLEAIIIFGISTMIMIPFIKYNTIFEISLINLIIYFIITLTINIIIYFFLLSLTFIFERTMTFANLLMTSVLFLTGMVFEFDNIFSKTVSTNLSNLLYGKSNILMITIIAALSIATYVFVKYTDRYLHIK